MSTMAKGSAVEFVLQKETTYKTPPAATSARALEVPFNANDVRMSRSLQQPETIRGDRSATTPFSGNKVVGGTFTAPVDHIVFGAWLKYLIGEPVTTEDIWLDNVLDIKDGSPTVTFDGATATFSVAQTTPAVGDRVAWNDKNGTRVDGWLKTKNTTSEWIISMDPDVQVNPREHERPTSAATVHCIIDQSITLTISSGTGTFSSGLSGATVGDRVVYEVSGIQREAFLTASTSDTAVWTVSQERDGGTNAADATAATVVAVVANSANATPGTVTVTNGAATFTQAQTSAAVGDMVILDIENAATAETLSAHHTQRYYISVKTSDTVMTLVDGMGHQPPNLAALTQVDAIESKPWFLHTYKIDATAALDSFTLERQFTDLSTPVYQRMTGCKINSMQIQAGGDGELTAALEIVGANEEPEAAAYDASVAALDLFADRFQQFGATVKEGGSANGDMRTLTVNHGNNLDTEQYYLGGEGTLGCLPEGIASDGGSLEAAFKDTTLTDKAEGEQETSIVLTFRSNNYRLRFNYPEVKLQVASPAVNSPGGVLVSLDFMGYKADGSEGSAIVATLRNQQGQYS